jgi:hypothetical protein
MNQFHHYHYFLALVKLQLDLRHHRRHLWQLYDNYHHYLVVD